MVVLNVSILFFEVVEAEMSAVLTRFHYLFQKRA